jgi:redox-sensitive bicupin YhaK (pirin superfamily)
LPRDWNSFIYILAGKGKFGTDTEQVEGTHGHTLILSKGESVFLKNTDSTELRFLLLAGEPLNEPSKYSLILKFLKFSYSFLFEIKKPFLVVRL